MTTQTTTETIRGTNGNDYLSGSDYDTTYYIYGGAGDDQLYGTGSADHLYGGTGNDYYSVHLDDKIYEKPGEGIDTIWSGSPFSLYGLVVENLVLFSSGAGTGNSLNNVITGNVGANILNGMDADDTLNGKGGKDVLIGGPGKDTFRYASSVDAHGDTINDFEHGIDRIDVSGMFDPYFRPGFTFIGTERFHKTVGELHVYHPGDGNTYVSGDTNGDGRSEFSIKVLGWHTFTKDDFVL